MFIFLRYLSTSFAFLQFFLGMLYHNEKRCRWHSASSYSSPPVCAILRGWCQQSLFLSRCSCRPVASGTRRKCTVWLEGLHLEIADWHAGNKFLKVWNIFINSTSLLCSLYIVHINRLFCSKWLLWLQSVYVFFIFFHSHMQHFISCPIFSL